MTKTLYGKGDRVRVATITSEMEAVVLSDEVVSASWPGRHPTQLCRLGKGRVRQAVILGRTPESKEASDDD